MTIEDAREAAMERARAQARADAAHRRFNPGQCFPLQREAYRETYFAHVRPAKMGRPKTRDFGGKKTSATMIDAAQPRAVTSPAAELPVDAVARRGVAGRVSASSSAAPAGVLSMRVVVARGG